MKSTIFREPKQSIIDIKTYSRTMFYEYFKTFDVPVNARTVTIDITRFKIFAKEKNLRFFVSFMYILNASLNSVNEFRHRIVKGKLVEFEFMFPVFTHLFENQVVFIDGIFTGDFLTDYQHNLNKSDNYKPGSLDPNRFNNQGHFILSNIPWYSFTSMTFPYSKDHGSVPVLGIGKYFDENNRLKMPLVIQTNHALVDGFHVGQLLEILQNNLNDPESILSI